MKPTVRVTISVGMPDNILSHTEIDVIDDAHAIDPESVYERIVDAIDKGEKDLDDWDVPAR